MPQRTIKKVAEIRARNSASAEARRARDVVAVQKAEDDIAEWKQRLAEESGAEAATLDDPPWAAHARGKAAARQARAAYVPAPRTKPTGAEHRASRFTRHQGGEE